MREYFGEAKPIYGWFAHLERFLEGAGFSYRKGSAVHLDLVQEATTPVWSQLPEDEKAVLLKLDLPFLDQQVRLRRLDAIFCNGRRVTDTVCELMGVAVRSRGELRRLRWWTGEAALNGKTMVLAGWNLPLDRATGLTANDERHFGQMLAAEMGLPGSVHPIADDCASGRKDTPRAAGGENRNARSMGSPGISPSLIAFVESVVLPAKAANPTHHRLDGRAGGGNRTVFGRFRHDGRIWKVHADTWFEPLLIAFEAAQRVEDPFIQRSTASGTLCLKLTDAPGIRAGSKHLYIYEA
jgi:hypothetical protein